MVWGKISGPRPLPNRIAYLISPFSDKDCHNYEVEDAKYSGPEDELYKELERRLRNDTADPAVVRKGQERRKSRVFRRSLETRMEDCCCELTMDKSDPSSGRTCRPLDNGEPLMGELDQL